MSVLNQSGEEQVECPLCMEPLEVDDLNFFPCTCGYQICRFCWHRIRTDENGLCPACRKAYPENPADFKPLSQEEVARLKAEKRHKDQQRKQKITENRKHLANVRVVQRNLVFVVGLPMRLADPEVLKKHEYFGKFGKIHKVVINQSTSYAGSQVASRPLQGPSASAYVTYQKADDALRAIQAVNNISVDGRTIKASLGTTKYCSHFMKNQTCPKPDCMYLHDLGDAEASFTKEEMQQGKHQEYEKKLHEQLLNAYNKDRKPTPSPPAITPTSGGGNSGVSSSSISGSNCSNSNTNIKGENNQRKQKFDQQSTGKVSNSHKKRHNSGEESRGKTKEKPHNTLSEDHKGANSKSSNSSSGSSQQQQQAGTTRLGKDSSRAANSFSSSSDGAEGGSEPEGEGESGRGGRASQRAATLFEPDNNSFFSSNSFPKVAASTASTGSTEWLPNGLTLAHMPDVLPPVHSSEDWQAAFGFSNSTNSHIHSQDNMSENTSVPTSTVAGMNAANNPVNVNHDMVGEKCDTHNDQQLFNSRSISHSSSLDSVSTKFGQNSTDDFRINGMTGHISHKGNTYRSEDLTTSISTDSGVNQHQTLPGGNQTTQNPNVYSSVHSTAFVQEPAIYMMTHRQFLQNVHCLGPQHLISNGLPPSQPNGSKFLADFHLRQQTQTHNSQHSSQQIQNHLDDPNYANNVINSGNLCGKYNNTGGMGQDNSGHDLKLQARDSTEDDDSLGVSDEEKYSHYNGVDQQKCGVENSSDGYTEYETDGRKSVTEDRSERAKGQGGRLADDELGFDPFHETQKALAEMMEKESSMMINQQHTHQPLIGQQQYHSHQHNHLHHPHFVTAGGFTGATKLLPTFSTGQQQQQQHHILSQENHRLATNVTSCTKLLEGLGIGQTNCAASVVPVTAPTRTRLPPPGFATAPNHMNAFGLGIPRAPTNTGSKILPFMSLGNNSSSSSNDSSSPVPQSINSIPNNISLPQPVSNQQSVLFPTSGVTSHLGSNSFGLQNGNILSSAVPKCVSDSYNLKEWPENLRSLVGSSGAVQSTTQHGPPHTTAQKGWNGVSPCTDWTALDPAIVSSSRPHSFHSAQLPLLLPPPPHLHHPSSSAAHWLRSLSEEGYWTAPTPPPGFSARPQPAADMTKIENL